MVARIWKARAAHDRAPRYAFYFNATVVPELRAVPGYQGAKVLTRTRADDTEIIVITWWASLEAVRAFAGEAVEAAVVHDEAAALLSDFERQVAHYEVAVDDFVMS